MKRIKISKLGLLLALVNTVLVIFFCYAGAGNGFGMIPILMIDLPVSLIAMVLGGMFLTSYTANYPMDKFIVFSISLSIFGGLQWYYIGWFIPRWIRENFPPEKK